MGNDLSTIQSFMQLNKTLFNEQEPNSPASISQYTLPSTKTHHIEEGQMRPQDQDDETSSNSSDPDRLEIEDSYDQENSISDAEENGYDMTLSKRPKLDNNCHVDRTKNHKSPERSPINRMDTPESNCSDTQDQETTKLWQALAK